MYYYCLFHFILISICFIVRLLIKLRNIWVIGYARSLIICSFVINIRILITKTNSSSRWQAIRGTPHLHQHHGRIVHHEWCRKGCISHTNII